MTDIKSLRKIKFMRKLSDEEAKELEDALAQNGFEFDTQEEAETFFFAQRAKLRKSKRIILRNGRMDGF